MRLIADTTIVPFPAFHAVDFGVDIEVVSSTKYISGGGTGLGGLLIDYGKFDWSQSPSPALQSRTKKVGKKLAFTARVKTELVTNLGSLGVESYTPVINPPQTAILGVDCVTRRVKQVNGQDVFYDAMGLSLTFDHRALDGAPAAKFLRDLVFNLENFDLLLAK